mmetsp:Transcript_7497/g.16405  ORF Transcript_7497/g.16405 Transcript_7497/m.16405 type:complete len:113 (+) Transcript_7497:272-610(+)
MAERTPTILVMATIGDDLTAATADTRASPPVPVTAGPFIRRRDRRRGRLLLGRSESIAKTKGRLKARSSDWTPDVLINERDQRRQQQPRYETDKERIGLQASCSSDDRQKVE